jgi:hypothetical protein
MDYAALFLGGALGIQGNEAFENFRVGQGGGPAIQQLIGHFILCNYCTNQSNFSCKLVAEWKRSAKCVLCITYNSAAELSDILPDKNNLNSVLLPCGRARFVCQARHAPNEFGHNYQS